MLAFKVHQLQLSGRHFLLLPKLNPAQVDLLTRRLASKGYTVRVSGEITARSKAGNVHISPNGLCWSTSDPADAVLPAIPSLLSVPKPAITSDELLAKYFRIARRGRSAVVRLSTRVESLSLWDELRASGECGLAPDEHHVITALIGWGGPCKLLTDFPTPSAAVRVRGRKQYYESTLGSGEARETLRTTGQRAARNSYVPRDGTLGFRLFNPPLKSKVIDMLLGLGEWCSFIPQRTKL